MTIFASMWWLWLLGLVGCAGFGLYKWLTGFWKTGGTIIKATTLTLEGVEVAFDEERNVSQKTAHARTRALEEVTKEGAERLKGFVVGTAAFACAGLFGLLLILSVVFQFLK
jgi:hypothetical protein